MTVRSWRQLVQDADPDFWQSSLRPIVYEFGARKFRDAHPLYGPPPTPVVLTIDDDPITIDGDVQTVIE